MANLQPQRTTDRTANILLDEEDERERVLLVELGTVDGNFDATFKGSDPLKFRYAMRVNDVREVIRTRAVTRVPGTPPVMLGLVNVRGMVVTVLDLAVCLGLPAVNPAGAGAETVPRAQTPGSIVLLEHGGRLVGLAVNRVLDVRPLDDTGRVPNDGGDTDGIVEGLASAGGEVVSLLDAAALLSRHLISSAET